MKWQEAVIIIAMLGALLLAVLTMGGRSSPCREGAARSADGQLCQEPKR